MPPILKHNFCLDANKTWRATLCVTQYNTFTNFRQCLCIPFLFNTKINTAMVKMWAFSRTGPYGCRVVKSRNLQSTFFNHVRQHRMIEQINHPCSAIPTITSFERFSNSSIVFGPCNGKTWFNICVCAHVTEECVQRWDLFFVRGLVRFLLALA